MKTTAIFTYIFLLVILARAQPPAGYYDKAVGKQGIELQQALHDIIKNHTSITYNELWTAFQETDKKANGKVWDIYSDVPGGTAPYQYTFITNQCGNYSVEGNCYNREHTFCQSWFKDGSPVYTDLFHLYPTDGYVNGKRNNNPFGEVGSVSWTSKNDSQLGDCASPGYSGTVFEPIDEYKGDIARGFFYIATRYYTEDAGWPGSEMVTGSQLKSWSRDLLMKWAQKDPVSQKEIDLNNKIYAIQHNRNPFIDHPEYITLLWGINTGISDNMSQTTLQVYPNPAGKNCSITLPQGISQQNYTLSVYTSTGASISAPASLSGDKISLDLEDFPKGFYLIRLSLDNYKTTYNARIIKN